jgi:hypothetical protein
LLLLNNFDKLKQGFSSGSRSSREHSHVAPGRQCGTTLFITHKSHPQGLTMRLHVALCLAAFTLPALAGMDYHKTAVTRWAGPGRPMSYEEYRSRHPRQPLNGFEVERRYAGTDQTGAFLVVVESSLLAPLQAELIRYLDDLTIAGWEPILLSFSGGTPENLRGTLQTYWASDSIKGALLVGDLPQAWYELYEDFDNDGQPDNPWMVQFPCDLFYMDMTGDWYDGNLNGVYDTHLNDWQPEIFVGQLISSPIGNEVELLRNYFDKNHAFRTGQLYLPGLGLAYIDDDWSGGAGQWGAALAQACGLVEIVGEPDSTTAAGYLDHLDNGYYSILLAAHSSPALHTLKEQGGQVWNQVYNWQITQTDPDAYFYNLFCCSGCRYNEDQYIGGCYLFADTYAQGVLGSTKTGSMLYFEDYYPWMEAGECVGEAFRRWFALHGQEPGSVMWSMSWFYGMSHLGDPTLFMVVGVEIASVEIVDDGSQGSSGDGDGVPDAGETVALNLTLQNNDPTAHQGVRVQLASTGVYASWLVDSIYVGLLPASGTAAAQGFLLSISPNIPDQANLNITAQIRDETGALWGDSFPLELRAPRLILLAYDAEEIIGDGDLYLDPGETHGLHFQIQNQGGDDSPETSFLLTSLSDWIEPDTIPSNLAPLPPGETLTTPQPVAVHIAESSPADFGGTLILSLTPSSQNPRFILQVGDRLNWEDTVTQPDPALVKYNISEGYFDQWHVSSTRSFSPAYAMKFGSVGVLNYVPMADGALELPLLPLGDQAELRFQHWMDVESGYDGGILEINRGTVWERISPQGGYPGVSQANGSYPGGPCYNGAFDWTQAVFDLSGCGPFARVRFRFGSDSGTEGEGWYVDDIRLSGDLYTDVEPTSAPHLPTNFEIKNIFPNPFNPTTTLHFELPVAGTVTLRIFDLAGRQVCELADERWEAGEHRVTFDGADLPSGIYFARWTVAPSASALPATTVTRKLALVK